MTGFFKGSAALVLASVLATSTGAADKKPPVRKRDPDAVRCVRSQVTGSLAQTQKICLTNREWDLRQDDARAMQSLICSDQGRCGGH